MKEIPLLILFLAFSASAAFSQNYSDPNEFPMLQQISAKLDDISNPIDLSTDAGRKAYLLKNPRYGTQYQGTGGMRDLQRDADALAGKQITNENRASLADQNNQNRLEKFQSQNQDSNQVANDADRLKKFYAAVDKSQKEAVEYFPQIATPNDPLNALRKKYWDILVKQNSPLCHYYTAPFIVTCIAAAQLGIKPVK